MDARSFLFHSSVYFRTHSSVAIAIIMAETPHDTWAHMPLFSSAKNTGNGGEVGIGVGIAYSASWNLVVVSSFHDILHVYEVQPTCFALLRSVVVVKKDCGRPTCTPNDGHLRGWVAFLKSCDGEDMHVVVVTDAERDCVYKVDILANTLDNDDAFPPSCLVAPGIIAAPRGITCAKDRIAISSWALHDFSCIHILVRGASTSTSTIDNWIVSQQINVNGSDLCGLRFSKDGRHLVVADASSGCMRFFDVHSPDYNLDLDPEDAEVCASEVQSNVPMGTGLIDVEELGDGWWFVTSFNHSAVSLVHTDSRTMHIISYYLWEVRDKDDDDVRSIEEHLRGPCSLVWLPDLGLTVRDWFRGVQTFSSLATALVGAMAKTRVAWMCAVFRARVL